MRTLNLLLKKFDEYGFEDFAVFADFVVVLFANSDQWEELPDLVRAEILELLGRQLENVQQREG
ncbi:hypothetical protein NIES2135_38710 [Leptolyngbya boryana NIES-2135]|uniref:Uncharacterized protein n=1 Tax=Leptolyngbya boryana NIES-2135 TaxID=1973484 RepID=A0A1Z4JK28_LEPBY|nr:MULTISPECIES: hypothetical protein [Leptolyngbya]BAY57008.1 hypothetical protein NIES2135_38710 [Leptolyngbya boryana NIES-2135]MBD2371376.1 hypothetical protein [Leptolyngbya sp. FACHB-161]MBD2377879.1 hypothetical protein [Leptolyngbya sp. FACHB-238]MBD2402319.1 hypothetical protein [Leptolyngbya sp. FACHB-239]MBD2408810.1 hypothetical protein [Leptolyngbya sp. FACHB-402]